MLVYPKVIRTAESQSKNAKFSLRANLALHNPNKMQTSLIHGNPPT